MEKGFDIENNGALLDFGCGCGRIIRHFARYVANCELHGTDVDGDSIKWCQENLEHATFAHGPADPLTQYSDGYFSGLYAFSVFSHLSEPRHLRWLNEIARITRTGATIVLTTHGRNCFQLYRDNKRPLSHPPASLVQEHLKEF